MHNGLIGKNLPSFTCINTKRMSSKTRCYVPVKQIFCTWMKTKETWSKLRDRDFIKKFVTGTWKFVDYADIFLQYQFSKKGGHHHFEAVIFQITGIFPTCFSCFLSANTADRKAR